MKKQLTTKQIVIIIASSSAFILLIGLGLTLFFTSRARSLDDNINHYHNPLHPSPDDDQTKDQPDDKELPPDHDTSPAQPELPPQNQLPTPHNISSPFIFGGAIIVNKKHPLPANYNPGENPEARAALINLINTGRASGLNIHPSSWSGFRSYSQQAQVFNSWVASHGQDFAESFSARPGYSEHQTGLAFDLLHENGMLYRGDDPTYDHRTDWVYQNAHHFGFIVRYRSDWQHITGYIGEPWHLRYLGIDLATRVFNSGLPLETFLGVQGGDYYR